MRVPWEQDRLRINIAFHGLIEIILHMTLTQLWRCVIKTDQLELVRMSELSECDEESIDFPHLMKSLPYLCMATVLSLSACSLPVVSTTHSI